MKLVLRPLTKCILHLLLLVQIQINIELAMLVTVWAEVHALNQKAAVDSQSCTRKDD